MVIPSSIRVKRINTMKWKSRCGSRFPLDSIWGSVTGWPWTRERPTSASRNHEHIVAESTLKSQEFRSTWSLGHDSPLFELFAGVSLHRLPIIAAYEANVKLCRKCDFRCPWLQFHFDVTFVHYSARITEMRFIILFSDDKKNQHYDGNVISSAIKRSVCVLRTSVLQFVRYK